MQSIQNNWALDLQNNSKPCKNNTQLTLDQHSFELHRSTCMEFVFTKNILQYHRVWSWLNPWMPKYGCWEQPVKLHSGFRACGARAQPQRYSRGNCNPNSPKKQHFLTKKKCSCIIFLILYHWKKVNKLFCRHLRSKNFHFYFCSSVIFLICS